MKLVLVAAMVGSLVTLGTAPASAEDHRPCVSRREFRTEAYNRRDNLERFWEVTHLGVPVTYDELPFTLLVDVQRPHELILHYPACGYSMAEAGVWVHYNPRTSYWFSMEFWKARTATLHGHQ